MARAAVPPSNVSAGYKISRAIKKIPLARVSKFKLRKIHKSNILCRQSNLKYLSYQGRSFVFHERHVSYVSANTLRCLKKKYPTELIWRKFAQNLWPSYEEKKFRVIILNSKLNGKRKEASKLAKNHCASIKKRGADSKENL